MVTRLPPIPCSVLIRYGCCSLPLVLLLALLPAFLVAHHHPAQITFDASLPHKKKPRARRPLRAGWVNDWPSGVDAGWQTVRDHIAMHVPLMNLADDRVLLSLGYWLRLFPGARRHAPLPVRFVNRFSQRSPPSLPS